jgi:hypothetical protein
MCLDLRWPNHVFPARHVAAHGGTTASRSIADASSHCVIANTASGGVIIMRILRVRRNTSDISQALLKVPHRSTILLHTTSDVNCDSTDTTLEQGPENPNSKIRQTPQYALYQRESFWKSNDGETPLFNTGMYTTSHNMPFTRRSVKLPSKELDIKTAY